MEDLIGEGRLTDIDFEAIESAATGDTDPEPSAFAQRVDREGRRRGFPEAQRRVILGDGAAWIWNIAGERGRPARILSLWPRLSFSATLQAATLWAGTASARPKESHGAIPG